jgi:hypothetical protein
VGSRARIGQRSPNDAVIAMSPPKPGRIPSNTKSPKH